LFLLFPPSVFTIIFLPFATIFTFCIYHLFNPLFPSGFFPIVLFWLLPFLTYGPGRAQPVENSCGYYVLSLFPVGTEIISFRSCVHASPGNHIASYAETVGAQGIGYIPLDRVTVKNSWRHSSTPVFHDVVMKVKVGTHLKRYRVP
jgi:hypothetical protein